MLKAGTMREFSRKKKKKKDKRRRFFIFNSFQNYHFRVIFINFKREFILKL